MFCHPMYNQSILGVSSFREGGRIVAVIEKLRLLVTRAASSGGVVLLATKTTLMKSGLEPRPMS